MREFLLILHFTGLAMGLGTSLAFLFLGIAGAKLEEEEALKFQLNTLALGRMGQIGLVLLILSGIFLMEPHWTLLADAPLLVAKLVLVLVLTGLIVLIHIRGNKARELATREQLNKIAPLGRVSLLVALAIVVLAVLHFK